MLALAGDGQADGRPYSWTFARDATHAWSLTTGSTPTLVPELPGIAVLPTLGFAAAEDAQRVVFDRLAAMRGEASRCEASHPLSPDCRDAWVAAVDSELTVGPGPGFGLRGHTRGLIAGVDRAMPSGEGLAFRAGAHAGVLRGDHTTAGGGHEDLRIGAARLRTSTPLAGFHASIAGTGGRTLEATLDAQRSRTQVFTGDGWFDTFTGSRLALRMQATQRFAAHGWALEPHLALGLVAQQWGDRYDAGGRDVLVGDDVVGQARIGLRVERTWAAWRPWATLAVEDIFGEGREALRLRGTAGETFALPGHDLRHGGTLEAGLEGRLPGGLQVFGSVTMGERGSGTSVSRRSATLGARWAW